jgi:tetratricopeptide (TPR) repeat protein
MELYGITEQEVFDRSLDLYRKALKLDPKNFPLATDYAQSYYGIKPWRAEAAREAWNYALKVANDGFEREGVQVHLARVEYLSGRFEQARQHLSLVTNQFYQVLKERMARNLAEKEKATNAAASPATLDSKPRRPRGELPLPARKASP